MNNTTTPRQWLVISLMTVSRFAATSLMGTVLAVLVEDQAGPLAAGLLGTTYYGGVMFLSPVWGALADISGRRQKLLVLTGAGAVLAVLPLFVSQTVPVSIFSRGVFAVFHATLSPVTLALVSQRGDAKDRGHSVGLFNSGRAGGFTMGYVVSGAVLEYVTPVSMFAVIAGLTLVSAVLALAVATPEDIPDTKSSTGEIWQRIQRRLMPLSGNQDHFSVAGLGWLYVALFLRNTTVLGLMPLMAPFLITVAGVSKITMGFLLACNNGSQVIFMYLLGRLADRVGRKPLVMGGMAGSGLFAAMAAGLPLLPDGPLLLLGGVITLVTLGASFSAMATGALAFIGDVSPVDRESEFMGLRETARGLGGLTGPVLVGGAARIIGYQWAFLGASVLGAIAAILVGVRLVESFDTETRRSRFRNQK